MSQCVFPSSLLKKLGVAGLRRRKYRRYGNVHYNYSDADRKAHGDVHNEVYYYDYSGLKPTMEESERRKGEDGNEGKEEDDSAAEEWERHEASVLREDDGSSTFDERAGPGGAFEREIELVWEKGGSGLVFWTGKNTSESTHTYINSSFSNEAHTNQVSCR